VDEEISTPDEEELESGLEPNALREEPVAEKEEAAPVDERDEDEDDDTTACT